MTAAVERMPQLSKYELLEEVGHGGMATVYRAVDRRLGREVAVKVIHRHLRENAEVAARFVSEARAVAKLKHRNIVEVYDVSDLAEEDRYLIVELVRGRTLRELLRAQKFLPPEVAAAVVLEAAAGLDHAHQLGVIHRDVKPENVLLAEPERQRARRGDNREPLLAEVKITDFGIAKLLDAQGVTATGQVLGSPAHMAPEQIEGGPVSVRADVFGLGVLMYETMVGKLPFEGNNPAQVLRRVLEGTFTAPERCRPTIGSGFGDVISRALAHLPEERFPSVAALADALKLQLRQLGFDDHRKEMTEFLADPDGYRSSHQERIVDSLVAVATEHRADGDVPGAAAAFNRALAYRPDDPDLIRAVTGIARSERLGRALRRTAAAIGVISLVSGAAWGAAALWTPAGGSPSADKNAAPKRVEPAKERASESTRPPKGAEATGQRPPPQTAKAEPAANPAAGPRSAAQWRASVPRTTGVAVAPPKSPRATEGADEEETGTRQVRVHISGAGGGKLKVDGKPREWFGVEHELELGKHTIEFIPPNEQCCIAPPPQVITVAPGTGPQQVHGHIEFRDAVVRLTGRPGVVLRCGQLFPGELAAPGERTVPMNQPVLQATCTLIAPSETGTAPKAIDVALRPGGTFDVAGP